MNSKPPVYSVSRLKTYQRCSYEYYHKYILKTPSEFKYSASTLLGTIVHSALEFLYTTDRDDVNYLTDALNVTVVESLYKSGLFKNTTKDEIEALVVLMNECAVLTKGLYERASAGYVGPNPIRVKGGGVAQNPTMTSDWKKAEEDLGIADKKSVIETFISSKEDIEISIPTVYTEAYYLCSRYRTSPMIKKIIDVEYPISHWDGEKLINPVKMPAQYGGKKGIYLNGYIDLIAELDIEGIGKGVAIIDHKTDKSTYRTQDVLYNRQMMIYVYAYEALTKKEVKYIGINNIREGFVVVPIDRAIMKECIDSLFSTHKLIDKGHFVKHTPDSVYSPCKDYYGSPCPFLHHCWKDCLHT